LLDTEISISSEVPNPSSNEIRPAQMELAQNERGWRSITASERVMCMNGGSALKGLKHRSQTRSLASFSASNERFDCSHDCVLATMQGFANLHQAIQKSTGAHRSVRYDALNSRRGHAYDEALALRLV
jgi:hypothetical protein